MIDRQLRTDAVECFEFENNGRKFACCMESRTPDGAEMWWWFRVSTEPRPRYAPFRAEPTDTPTSVQPRIVSFYDNLLERRAMPAPSYWRRGSKPVAAVPERVVPEGVVPAAVAAG